MTKDYSSGCKQALAQSFKLIENGKIIEQWGGSNLFDLLQQLDVEILVNKETDEYKNQN